MTDMPRLSSGYSDQKTLAVATTDAVQQPQVLACGSLAGFEVTLYGRF
jgi:hypothetical protein